MRVATDIGGTFTDLIYLDEASGEMGMTKASTTPHNFAIGVEDTLEKSGINVADTTFFVGSAAQRDIFVFDRGVDQAECRKAVSFFRPHRIFKGRIDPFAHVHKCFPYISRQTKRNLTVP